MSVYELFFQHFMFENAAIKTLGKYLVKHSHRKIKQNQKTEKPT